MTKLYTGDEMEEILMDVFGVSEETIKIITNIHGWNKKTFEDILYAVSGFEDFDQVAEDIANGEL